jgi:hypothetical protein
MKSITALALLLGSITAASAQYYTPPGYVPNAPQVPDFSPQANPLYRPIPQMQVPQYQAPRQCSIQCQDIGFQRNCHEVCY